MSSIPSPKSHLQVSASDPCLPLTSRKQTAENSARPASECVQLPGDAGSATAAGHGLVKAPTPHREKPKVEQRRGETSAGVRMAQWLKRRKKRLDVVIYGADREKTRWRASGCAELTFQATWAIALPLLLSRRLRRSRLKSRLRSRLRPALPARCLRRSQSRRQGAARSPSLQRRLVGRSGLPSLPLSTF